MWHGEILPVERVLFESDLVRIGAFRCAVSDPLFHDSGPIRNHVVVFPRTAVKLQYEGGRPFVATPNVVTLYNRGQVYVRDAVGGRLPAAVTGRRASWALVTTGVLLVAAAGMFVRARRQPAPDPDLLVVAPFDVLVPDHALWREGMVDVLSRNLDGAGPLRTVPPTVAIRRWKGRVDVGPATALGRETGAALAVFGRLLDAGPDSVRISAALVDVARRTVTAEFEFRGGADRIGGLADSLTVALLDQIGRARPIGAVRYTGLAAVPLPALKAFLRGEVERRSLLLRPAATWGERGIDVRTGVRVAAVDPAAGEVALDDGSTLGFERLVLATGSRNRRLDVPGMTLEGVFDLRNVEDAERLREAAVPGSRAVIS